MIFKNKFFFFFSFLVVSNQLFSMTYDSRYFPLHQKNYLRSSEKPSTFGADIFTMICNSAAKDTDDSFGIQEMFGKYDQRNLSKALTALNVVSPLPAATMTLVSDFDTESGGLEVPWNMNGKMETQGISFMHEQSITDKFSVGASFFLMHMFSRIGFEKPEGATYDETNFGAKMRSMHDSLGIQAPKWNKSGISDIELFIRFGSFWDYFYKFRHIEASLKGGVFIPTGVCRNIDNPASIPFGGNGHWGIYGAGSLEIEFKEDWRAGVFLQFSNRFSKTKKERIAISGEQLLFGVVKGDIKNEPGYNITFSPYFRLDDIRDGLGIQGRYTLTWHNHDLSIDKRSLPQSPVSRLEQLNDYSSWTSAYVTVHVFYDFARVRPEYSSMPTVSMTWDMPIQFYASERVCKTHRFAAGFAFNF